jgi:hypothetical protein
LQSETHDELIHDVLIILCSTHHYFSHNEIVLCRYDSVGPGLKDWVETLRIEGEQRLENWIVERRKEVVPGSDPHQGE